MRGWHRWGLAAAIAVVLGVVLDAFVWHPKPDRRPADLAYFKARAEARSQTWAEIRRTKEVAPGKTFSWIVVPDPGFPGSSYLDTHCLVFESQAGATMVCPNAGRWASKEP